MKLSHFIFILLFILIASTSSAAYIDEISTDSLKGIQYSENDSIVSLDGFNFTIPKGFGLIENESFNHTDGNLTESEKFYVNEANETIMISTASIIREDLILSDYTPSDVDMTRHVVNGHEGIEWSMNNSAYFIYFDNDHLITVGAPENSYFEDIIH